MTRPVYVTPAERVAFDGRKFGPAVRAQVVALRESGLTLQQIATQKGCSRQAVSQMLKRHAAAVDRRNREA